MLTITLSIWCPYTLLKNNITMLESVKEQNSVATCRFNVITDKGTLDAIGLSENAETAR